MAKLAFSWRNLTVETETSMFNRSKKVILKNVSGHVEPGELLAVMGPSSAGKTTLFNALMIQNLKGIKITSGDRLINGQPMTAKAMSHFAGYVPQNDLFIGSLTVREHLTFLSNLRLKSELTPKERAEKVEKLIRKLGLLKCRDTVIGIRGRLKGISGGEMRRLCFASEILGDPPLLLCDEPTTGLDSWMAENLVNVMKEMCSQGRSVLCIIHQPNSELFQIFDRVLLLSEGRTAFMGSRMDAIEFFNGLSMPCPNNFNPADHYIYKLSMVPGHENEYSSRVESICDNFDKSEYAQLIHDQTRGYSHGDSLGESINIKDIEPYKSGWMNQFQGCLWRAWHSIVKEPAMIKIRIVQNIMFALIVGIIYYPQEVDQNGVININGVLFWSVMNQVFTSFTLVLTVFANEIPIMRREHLSGLYRVDVYYLARQLADVPLFILTSVIFMAILYFLALPDQDAQRFFMATLVVMLVVQASVAMGYLGSAFSPNATTAVTVMPVLTTPLLVFGGIYGSNSSLKPFLLWMKYISVYYYGNEALQVNQWKNVEEIACNRTIKAALPEQDDICLSSGMEVLEFYSMDPENLHWDLGMLFALNIGMRIIAYFGLLFKCRRPTSKTQMGKL